MTAQRQDAERWRVVRELFEDCHAPGAGLSYDGVVVQKVEWCDEHTLWRVFVGEQWVDSIRVGRFRSARALYDHLTHLETVEVDPYAVPSVRTA